MGRMSMMDGIVPEEDEVHRRDGKGLIAESDKMVTWKYVL